MEQNQNSHMDPKFKILDCTLRDGGYYNDWNFSEKDIHTYFNIVNNSDIDMLEVCFLNKSNFLDLKIQKDMSKKPLGCMVSIKDLVADDDYFVLDHTIFSFLRIVTKLEDVKKSIALAKDVKNKVEVFINIQKFNLYPVHVVIDAINYIKNEGFKVYLADTYGSALPSDIEKLYAHGYHAHDNKSLALASTINAVNIGYQYVDGTLMGFGRGAGNCRTEYILEHYNKQQVDLGLMFKWLVPFKEKYQWGTSIDYFKAAHKNIHPNDTIKVYE